MYAAAERDLPALRLNFEDQGQTLVYIGPSTGDVVLSVDKHQHTGRWLFNLLHSWDLPWILRQPIIRETVLVALSAGAMALALTGGILGYRRLMRSAGSRRNEPVPRPLHTNT